LIAGGSGNITLDSILLEALNGGEISLSAGGNITTTGGAITHNGAITAEAGNDLDFSTFGLRSNNGAITLKAARDALLSTSVNAGAGTINVTAERDISVTPHDLTTGLIDYWALDEGNGNATNDSAGNYDGSILGDTVWSSDTPFGIGSSLSFDGSGDKVNFGDINEIELAPLTISFWARTIFWMQIKGFSIKLITLTSNRY
ncbi:MAG: hypothetical protein LRY36_00980, partial [Alphaproteobacteria bacterium]|nr:hypothetical protein [Alphaproteobacteria bacterium]